MNDTHKAAGSAGLQIHQASSASARKPQQEVVPDQRMPCLSVLLSCSRTYMQCSACALTGGRNSVHCPSGLFASDVRRCCSRESNAGFKAKDYTNSALPNAATPREDMGCRCPTVGTCKGCLASILVNTTVSIVSVQQARGMARSETATQHQHCTATALSAPDHTQGHCRSLGPLRLKYSSARPWRLGHVGPPSYIDLTAMLRAPSQMVGMHSESESIRHDQEVHNRAASMFVEASPAVCARTTSFA